MYQIGSDVPDYDTVLGGNEDITILGYNINRDTNRFWVKFKRKLNTNDQYDFTIEKKKAKLIYSYS